MPDSTPAGPKVESDAQNYTCPDCGQRMTPGFLALSGRANWVEHEGAFDARAFKGDNIVGMAERLAGTAHLRGWRCEDCLLILLEY
jgi:hypothetical protein